MYMYLYISTCAHVHAIFVRYSSVYYVMFCTWYAYIVHMYVFCYLVTLRVTCYVREVVSN